MTSPVHPRTHRPLWPIVALAIAVALVCAIAAWHPWTTTSVPASGGAADAGPAEAIVPAPLALPEHARVLIFGDSWTYGSAAQSPTDGYAYVVGRTMEWDTTVDGVRGSGYLKPGIDGPAFGQRIAKLDPALKPDLVIIQGSINDRRLYPTGYRAAVTAAWNALAKLYPEARFVVLGPAPQVLPVEKATARIDHDLGALAATRGWTYISPVQEKWITRADYAWIIDTGIGRDHPTTAGHAYLAERLAEDIRRLEATTDAAVEAPAPDQ